MGQPSLAESALLATGVAIFAAGIALVLPEHFPWFLEKYDVDFRLIGFVFIAIGIFCCLAALSKWLLYQARRLSNLPTITGLIERYLEFDEGQALASDVEQICSLGANVIGDNHATEDVLKERLKRCPSIIIKLSRSKSPHQKINAYFIIYPLTRKAAERIDARAVINGKSLQLSDIATDFQRAKAIYISMIYGDGLLSKAAALFHLKGHIGNLRKTNAGLQKLYARPSTRDGKRLLEKFSFSPIDEESGIWVRNV